MPERLLVVPAETVSDGPTTYEAPKYGDRVGRYGCRVVTIGGVTLAVVVFVAETDTLDGIEAEVDAVRVPEGPGVDQAIERVTQKSAWTGPPLSSVSELHEFLRP